MVENKINVGSNIRDFRNLYGKSCSFILKAFSIGLKIVLEFITEQLPFSSEKTRKQLLQATLTSPRRQRRLTERACGAKIVAES